MSEQKGLINFLASPKKSETVVINATEFVRKTQPQPLNF